MKNRFDTFKAAGWLLDESYDPINYVNEDTETEETEETETLDDDEETEDEEAEDLEDLSDDDLDLGDEEEADAEVRPKGLPARGIVAERPSHDCHAMCREHEPKARNVGANDSCIAPGRVLPTKGL